MYFYRLKTKNTENKTVVGYVDFRVFNFIENTEIRLSQDTLIFGVFCETKDKPS